MKADSVAITAGIRLFGRVRTAYLSSNCPFLQHQATSCVSAYNEPKVQIDPRSLRVRRIHYSRPVCAIIDMRQYTKYGSHLSIFLFVVYCNLATRYPMLALFARCVVFFGVFAIYLRSCASLVLPGGSTSIASVSVNSSISTLTGLSTNDTVAWNAPKCVSNQEWMGGGISESDCRLVVHAFYTAIRPQFERAVTFVAADSHSIAPPDAQRLPRKYIYGEWQISDAAQTSLMAFLSSRLMHIGDRHDDY